MYRESSFSLNMGGRLLSLERPVVMGILNRTPDSFYAGGRQDDAESVCRRAEAMLGQGAAILDVGACSTRPGSEPVSEEEEWRRLEPVLAALRGSFPEALLSVDTFRPSVAEKALRKYAVSMINDVTGGSEEMYRLVAERQVPYVLTYPGGGPDPVEKLISDLSVRISRLRELGLNDLVVDPGFGFGKTLEDNYELLRRLSDLFALEAPILVGISRKSMIYNILNETPEGSLAGTVAADTLALAGGADILRVHDVREAVQSIAVFEACSLSKTV